MFHGERVIQTISPYCIVRQLDYAGMSVLAVKFHTLCIGTRHLNFYTEIVELLILNYFRFARN